MGMGIDESRRHKASACIQHVCIGRRLDLTYGADSSIGNGHIAHESGLASTVEEGTATDEKVRDGTLRFGGTRVGPLCDDLAW